MIRRLLIANRGEIALRDHPRVPRDGHRERRGVLGRRPARAPHARAADRAVHIGRPPPAESYLNVDALIAAARQTGADAVHPGYGFLSERARFARACSDAGLDLRRPPAGALERMGSKIGARRLMQDAGVPVVPGETPKRSER